MLSGPLERIIWVRPRPQTWASVPSLALYDVWDWVKLEIIVVIVGAGAAVYLGYVHLFPSLPFAFLFAHLGVLDWRLNLESFSRRRERYLGTQVLGWGLLLL